MAEYLRECLQSILAQGYPSLEIIVIDGGSGDNTAAVAAEFAHLIDVFVSEPDNGQADAVTKGLLLATGDIIHWHAADDLVMPDAFAAVAACFDGDPEVGLVISDGYAFDKEKAVRTGQCRWLTYEVSLYHFGRFQSDCAYWRASLTDRALPLDVDKPLTVDEDFFLRLWRGAKHVWLPVPLGAFRMHGNQVSQRLDKSSVPRDRQATRSRIFLEEGQGVRRVLLKKWSTLPAYFIRGIALPRVEAALIKIKRIATSDRARRRLHANLIESRSVGWQQKKH